MKPNNQTCEVLYELLTNAFITRMQIFDQTGILNVTARIANLRNDHGLKILCNQAKAVNKHGRKITYGMWYVEDKQIARELYEKINKK
jgi:hypothetical protein